MKKNILVTGAAGFIGFHLIKKLIELGYNVIGLDNINDYYDVNLKFDRLSQLGINKVEGKKFNNLSRWYLEIASRSKVKAGYDLLKKGETIPGI